MIKTNSVKVLYISYDGILEPLGQSQVLRYLEKLSTKHEIYLISFEKPDDWAQIEKWEALKGQTENAGIHWIPMHYHKRPSGLATAFDILQGIVVGCWITIRHGIQIVHARSYVPSVIALFLKKMLGVKYIFDMRGFWADERVDGGLWSKDGRMYRVAKWFERRFLLSADRVVSLTNAAVDVMTSFPYLQEDMPHFEVITTCTDLDLFKPDEAISGNQKKYRPFTLGYVGSVGVWYLFDETLKCFKELLRLIPNARLQILNRGEHDYIHERITAHGISEESIRIEVADHTGVAEAMQKMDAGVFIIKPAYSKLASAPTKLGEFLGCGVPCMGNTNVGEMADILEGEQVGVALDDFSENDIEKGIARLVELTREPDIKQRCRQVALNHFSLESGVAAYDRIYNELQRES
jgi:glycosyltransferase involved in cell wall biosynthesis